MTLKERLHSSIETLGRDELMLVYEQIHLLQQIRQKAASQVDGMELDRILEMTRSSNSSWSDTVQREREERG
ncbi:MAG: hypothetical protein GY801_12550 [bacterium]|nr:hypothetical protein [bacterium]